MSIRIGSGFNVQGSGFRVQGWKDRVVSASVPTVTSEWVDWNAPDAEARPNS